MRALRLFLFIGLFTAGAVVVAGASPKVSAQDEDAMLRRLARVGGRVEAAVRELYPRFMKNGRHLSFSLTWDESLNATCQADGRITITTGFMQALAKRPDDELAAVLGHEAIHLAQRHHVITREPISLRDVIEEARGNSPATNQVPEGRAESTFTPARYSRDDEYKADAGCVKLLREAGYDPNALPDLLQMLTKRDEAASAKGGGVGWLANHPEAEKRVASAARVTAEKQ